MENDVLDDVRDEGEVEFIRLDAEIVRLSDRIAYSEQPTFADLRALRDMGFQLVVNARLPSEQPAEAPDAARAGLRYAQIPMPSVSDIEESDVRRLAEVMRRFATDRVLVHSAEGARAGVLSLAWLAGEQGWSVEQFERRAKRLGLDAPEGARLYVQLCNEERGGVQPGA